MEKITASKLQADSSCRVTCLLLLDDWYFYSYNPIWTLCAQSRNIASDVTPSCAFHIYSHSPPAPIESP